MTEEVKPEMLIDFESKPRAESNLDSLENSNVDLVENSAESIGECETLLDKSISPIIENQDMTEKTSEGDNGDQTNSSKSKELKLLLALSKEANLETNIAHKRRNVIKKKELSKHSTPDGKRLSKGSQDNRLMKFPVTAEDELEQGSDKSEVKPSNSVTNKSLKRTRDSSNESHTEGSSEDSTNKTTKKTFSAEMKLFKVNKDIFCWRCHREGVNISCETCPRSYHQKCLKQTLTDTEHWPCPECVAILKAESTQTRSEVLRGMTLEHLCSLLKFAVTRMIQCQGSEPFVHPVSDKEFPEYKKYIVQPMDLTKLEKNIKNNLYGSTQAFEADAKWILHNSIIFNSTNDDLSKTMASETLYLKQLWCYNFGTNAVLTDASSKLTYAAKSIVKICKEEMSEIENCPNCYLNANTKKSTWFVEVCPKPHLLVWAKLKGFPYWPAKIMSISAAGMVDVRFFGAHDRAWIHHKECYLYSEKDPNTFKQKRFDIEQCIEELNIYVSNLKKNFGEFRYAPYRTFVDPNNELKQLQIFLPKYKGPTPLSYNSKKQSRESLDKSSDYKSDSNEQNTTDHKLVDSKNEKEDTSNDSDKDDTNRKETNAQKKHKETSPVPREPSPKPKLQNIELEESCSNAQSPVNDKDDNKSLMEGYGTDDDSVSEINLERRRALVHKDVSMNEEQSDEEIEDEDDENDTQVPNNISLNKGLLKGTAKTRCISLPTPSNPPRRKSDVEGATKRLSTDDRKSPEKKSRRNSDLSIKSDSSRLSNISDKINRIEFSEDMEISLGNDEGCVSISENITPPNGEASKSGSESSFEHKRRPVQVDIDNAEFTISPTNKIKISEKLIKRLTTSKSDQDKKVEEIRKSLVEKPKSPPSIKSQTDMLIEKFKDLVEHEVVNFNESSDKSLPPKEINTDKALTECSETENIISNISRAPELTPSDSIPINEIIGVTSTSVTKRYNLNAKEDDLGSINKDTLVIDEKEASKTTEIIEPELPHKEEVSKTTNSPKGAKSETDSKKSKLMIQPAITEYTLKKNENISEKPGSAMIDKQGQEYLVNGVKSRSSEAVNIVEESDEDDEEMNRIDELQIDKKNIFNIIHSSLNEARKQSSQIEPKTLNQEPTSNQEDKLPTKKIKVPVKEFQTYSNQRKFKHLNQEKLETQDNLKPMPVSDLETTPTLKTYSKKPPEEDASTSNIGKKRKRSFDEPSNPQPKLVKLVSIEKILNKDLENNESTNNSADGTTQNVQQTRQSTSSENVMEDISPEGIKSEIESDDDFNEIENLDAKRRYLSALNISEKTLEDNREKENEIRTRAKAEEKRERFRIIDNLTKVIDDVALNYSAQHEGERLPPLKNSERRKSSGNIQEGEIFVKSFAKIRDTGVQQRARKTFPAPSYMKNISKPMGVKKDSIQTNNASNGIQNNSPKISITGTKVSSIVNINSSSTIGTSSTVTNTSSNTPTILNKTLDTSLTAVSHVILFPGPKINYGSPIMNPVINGVSAVSSMPTTAITTSQTSVEPTKSILCTSSGMVQASPNLSSSQNYIPQLEKRSFDGLLTSTASNGNIILNHLLEQPSSSHTQVTQEIIESGNSQPVAGTSTAETTNSGEIAHDDEFAVLNTLVPESVSRAVSDLLLRPPPRLKPRPPGALSTNFDEGIPSSAGNITSKINSISHRLGDYFRGMLIETLEDLGKSANPEARIINLQSELEVVKHRHNLELAEIRKNICTILKDIQKSILEEKERIIDETRAACEIEAIKRIEVAKSKQWCANCSKEAQFYCCWNTSYCDYPCQQKHWPQHMGKCTQNIEKCSNSSGPNRSGNPVILRQSGPPKPGLGPRIMTKPTKVYMNKAATQQKAFKAVTSTGNQITVVETTPGNYELLSNGSVVTGKIFTASSNIFNSKFKTGMVTSPSTSKSPENKIPRLSSSESSICLNPAVGMPVQAILEDDS